MATTKKRTADGGPAPPMLKRRKPSTMSIGSIPGSAHPLRQTSFPPDDPMTPFGARSPSVDFDNMSLVSGSQVSAAAHPKKKRGRKSKADKAREQTPSVVGGRGTAAASLVGSEGGRGGTGGAGGAAGDEGDADDEGPTEVAATAEALTKEQKEEEHRLRSMLIGAFSEDQFDRFENWRAANLSKAVVRRVSPFLSAQRSLPDILLIMPLLISSSSTPQSRNRFQRTLLLACAPLRRCLLAILSRVLDGYKENGLSEQARNKPTSPRHQQLLRHHLTEQRSK